MVGVIVVVFAGTAVVAFGEGVALAEVTFVGVAEGDGTMSVGAAPGVSVITVRSVGRGVSEMTATTVGSDVGAGWLQAANNNSASIMKNGRILLGVRIVIPSVESLLNRV